MGIVMTSFSLATVAGVPVGLFLANHFGWHIPFFMLTGTSSIVLCIGYFVLPPINGHIGRHSGVRPVRALLDLVTRRNHIDAFLLMAAMMIAGFSVIPYLSPYMVSNVGLTEQDLPLIYFFGGGATIFTSRFIGRLSDRYGKKRVFMIIAAGSIIPIIAVTSLPAVPLWAALFVTTIFMILTSGRMVPAMALVTSSVAQERRGSFMSINSSIQQISSGAASYVAGLILGSSASGALVHFEIVGIFAALTSVLCIYLSTRIRAASVQLKGTGSAPEISFESM
jgi:predicted MFS family arabinose efflux permease